MLAFIVETSGYFVKVARCRILDLESYFLVYSSYLGLFQSHPRVSLSVAYIFLTFSRYN